MGTEAKTCEESKPETTPGKCRVRNFFKVQKGKFAQAGSVLLVSGLMVTGGISAPVFPKELSPKGREHAAELAQNPSGERMGLEQERYLGEILSLAHETGIAGEIDSIVKHPKFAPFMLDYLGIELLDESYDWQETPKKIRWFREILDVPWLQQHMVADAIREYDSKRGGIAVYLHENIEYAKLGSHTIRHVRERFGRDYRLVLEGMKKISENPNFHGMGGQIAAPEQIWGALQIVRRDCGGQVNEVYAALEAYYPNPNFGKGGFPNEGEIAAIAKRTAEFRNESALLEKGFPELMLALLKNPNFSIEDFDKKLAACLDRLLRHLEGEALGDWSKEKMPALLQSPMVYRSMLEPEDELWIGKMAGWNKNRMRRYEMLEALGAFASGECARGAAARGEQHVRHLWKKFHFVTGGMYRSEVYALGLVGATDSESCREVFGTFCSSRNGKCKKAAGWMARIKGEMGALSENGNALEFLNEVMARKQQNDVPYSIGLLLTRSEFGRFDYPGGFDALYRDGKEMAIHLGAKQSVATYLNFAYAIADVGPEMASKMYREFGIENFLRYSFRPGSRLINPNPPSLLRMAAQDLANPLDGRPLLVMATSKADWNGAFGMMYYNQETFAKSFRVALVEGEKDTELIEKIAHVGKRYGKIRVLLLSGHGYAKGIVLGHGHSGRDRLDAGDAKKLEMLRGAVAPDVQVVLNSCSTGAWDKGGIGHAIARALKGAEVFAPRRVVDTHKIAFDPDAGKITEVTYQSGFMPVATNVFQESSPLPPGETLPQFAMRIGPQGAGRLRGVIIGEAPPVESGPTEDEAYWYLQQEQEKMNNLIILATGIW